MPNSGRVGVRFLRVAKPAILGTLTATCLADPADHRGSYRLAWHLRCAAHPRELTLGHGIAVGHGCIELLMRAAGKSCAGKVLEIWERRAGQVWRSSTGRVGLQSRLRARRRWRPFTCAAPNHHRPHPAPLDTCNASNVEISRNDAIFKALEEQELR